MSYQKADRILPRELLEQVQEYVDGALIYIPKTAAASLIADVNSLYFSRLSSVNNNCVFDERPSSTIEIASNQIIALPPIASFLYLRNVYSEGEPSADS